VTCFLQQIERHGFGPAPSSKPEQSTFLIDPAKPATIACRVTAAKGTVAYSLLTQSPGVTFDAKTGIVTVDANAASDAAAKALAAILYPTTC
jgi:hypothetical protein